MTAEICLSTAPVQELYFTDTDEDAMAQFQSALDACVHGWYQGNNVALLENNIQDLFGIMLMQYFERCLTEQVGQPVAFTFADGSNGPQTFVQMPKNTNAQAHLQMPPNGVDPQTHIGQQPATFSKVVSAGVKKAPRPMNCWIIFRDAMHKKLKAENPHLTVQQISTRCSQIWHGLSPKDKKPWQAAAKSAKEEHLRIHPDYKYSPRKPGEKKKRQSRKAKQAPTFAADPCFSNFPPVSELPALTDAGIEPHALAHIPLSVDNAPVDFGSAFAADVAQLVEPTTLLGLEMDDFVPVDYLHDSESLRHDRLEAEFEPDLEGSMPFDLFGEEAFAFRAGADGNATLPSIYSDLY